MTFKYEKLLDKILPGKIFRWSKLNIVMLIMLSVDISAAEEGKRAVNLHD